MSARRREELAELRAARVLAMMRAKGHCECGGFNPGCPGYGSEAHHVVRRSQGGDHHPDNLRWLHPDCHRLVHANPAAAAAAGLLARRSR